MKIRLKFEEEYNLKYIDVKNLTIITGNGILWRPEFLRQVEIARSTSEKRWGGFIDISPKAEYDSFCRKDIIESKNPELTEHLETILGGKYVLAGKEYWNFITPDEQKYGLDFFDCPYVLRQWRTLYLLLKYELKPTTMAWIKMIDPENGLPFEKQMEIAQFIVHLVNAGYRVFLCTNSEIILDELGLLMSLSRQNLEVKRLRAKQSDGRRNNLLDYRKVIAYDMLDGVLQKSRVTHDYIAVESMGRILRENYESRLRVLKGEGE